MAITNKIDDKWPYADRLKTLLHPNISLDDVFSNTCIPVLLTYDSKTLAKYNNKVRRIHSGNNQRVSNKFIKTFVIN